MNRTSTLRPILFGALLSVLCGTATGAEFLDRLFGHSPPSDKAPTDAVDADAGGSAGSLAFEGPDILPVDEAFVFSAEPRADGHLELEWRIVDGYYLYRDKIKVALAPGDESGARLTLSDLPGGESVDDPIFGRVQIFKEPVVLDVRAGAAGVGVSAAELTVSYQGCAEVGVCYPPQKRRVYLPLPEADSPGPESGAR